MPLWLIGIIGFLVMVIVGIVLFLAWKKYIDKPMDKMQHKMVKFSQLFAQYKSPFMAELFENLAVDDYEAFIKQISDMMDSPRTMELFVTQIAKPLAEGYKANPEALQKIDS